MSDKKDIQLGMSFSTARSRLVKLLLFDLLKRLGEDNCFKCKNKITHIDDLSIEHKIPWLDNSPELFWDLNNTAFSHIKCNKPHRFNGGNTRIEVTEGMAWCYKHKKFLPVNEFTSNKSRWTGYSSLCKTHNNEYRKSKKHFYKPWLG